MEQYSNREGGKKVAKFLRDQGKKHPIMWGIK